MQKENTLACGSMCSLPRSSGGAQKSKAFVREKILERIPEETLKHQITGLLFERDYEELLAQIREVQKTTRPRRRNMSEQRRTIKAVRKKRSAAKKRAGS